MKKLLAAILFVPVMAHAEFKTGNELLSDMQSENIVNKMAALGYIMGVTDALRGTTHCPPAEVTAGQLRDMIKSTLESAPQIRHYTADAIVSAVLGKAWPCANKKSGVGA